VDKSSKIYIAGHRGMVGSALVRKFTKEGYKNIISFTSKELDLRDQSDVRDMMEEEKPDYLLLAAAKVGGIYANNVYRADFLYDNLMIQSNGIKLCDAFRDQHGCNFIAAMPTNLYGPNDNYDLQNSHVLPALIRKFHEAKINKIPEVIMWGTGSPLREFLHVDDLAEACFFMMENYNERGHLNVGSGSEISIKNLAETIKNIVGYDGKIVNDLEKPDGTPRKLMDVSKIHSLGWKHKIGLEDGITSVYKSLSDKNWY